MWHYYISYSSAICSDLHASALSSDNGIIIPIPSHSEYNPSVNKDVSV